MQETSFTGILELIGGKSFGFARAFQSDIPKGPADPFVSQALVQKHRLRDGVVFEGTVGPGRKGAPEIKRIERVMGMNPADWARLKPFDSGRTVYPYERFDLVRGPQDVTLRVLDLAVPLGKGQRTLIVAPPRAGKTILLKSIAEGLQQNHPDVDLLCLLVDERPEEVTDFKRTTEATVFASSSDREEDNHVRVATMAHEFARRLVEQKRDVVLLVDSLTRLGRTFNLYLEGSGRTISGGLDVRAMTVPRKIFGSARKIEGGGSLTIIATALVETGSRMDEVIFEEFKGTGNAEIVLDRELAQKRLFPAINLRKSGTRNEELLLGDRVDQQHRLMRLLNQRNPVDSLTALIRHVQTSPSNDALLDGLVPKRDRVPEFEL
ncbi:MAG: transcription termination factor Rho, partial [Rhodothermales bacterium]|nr:transcription termination factor Rho [Rhodothermales bacterium]MCA0268614.1 transcription termination factor Rho [Bacteroidota bacterium]